MNNPFIKFIIKNEFLLIILILLIGFFVRIFLIHNIQEPINKDAEQYYRIALNLISNNGFSIDGEIPTARRSPGYPFLLASIMVFSGSDPIFLYYFQTFLNIITILFTYLCLKYFYINTIKILIIISIFTFSTSFVFVNVLYATIPTMFFIALLLYVNIKQTNMIIKALISGVLVGVLIYIRPTFLYFPLFLMINLPILVIAKNKQLSIQILIISITALIILVPWTLRNKTVFNKWIPLVAAGGKELWQANVEIQYKPIWYSVTNIQKYEDQRTRSSLLQSKLITQIKEHKNIQNKEDLNKILSKEAKGIILRHPIRFSILCINRFLIFWFSPPIGSSLLKSISPFIFWIILMGKYLITIFSIIGLLLLSKKHFEKIFIIMLLVLYLTLLHSAIHSIQRYFLPLLPICYFVLGYFLNIIFIKWKARNVIINQ